MMPLNFDFPNIVATEFGVGRDSGDGQTLAAIPVDDGVQLALGEMISATVSALKSSANTPEKYDPSEKHGSTEHLYLDIDDPLAVFAKEIHEAENLSIDTDALNEPEDVFCYFARTTDKQLRRVTAVRRATQFKGILKSRLIRWGDDTLRIVGDHVFKLDNDFDFLVDDKQVHILRPAAFEFAGQLQGAIMATVPTNVAALKLDLPFVAFENIGAYAAKHPKAARYLASIRGQEEAKNIDKALLKKACRSAGFELKESKGRLSVPAGNELDFLEVVDRRRYVLELVEGQPERFRAASRSRLVSN